MASVTKLEAKVKTLGDLYGDVSKQTTSVAAALSKQGYLANVRAVDSSWSYLRQANVFGALLVTLTRKGGAPFDSETAKSSIASAASSIGLKLALAKDWVVQYSEYVNPVSLVKTGAEGTAEYAQQKKAEYDACIAAGGSPLTCAGAGAGIPKWVWWVGGAFVGLYALNTLTQAKRTFLGGTRRR